MGIDLLVAKPSEISNLKIQISDFSGILLQYPTTDGRIVDFTVMVRPLTGVVALAEAVGQQLAAAEAAQQS